MALTADTPDLSTLPMIMSLVFNDAGEIIASQVYLDPGRVRAQAQ